MNEVFVYRDRGECNVDRSSPVRRPRQASLASLNGGRDVESTDEQNVPRALVLTYIHSFNVYNFQHGFGVGLLVEYFIGIYLKYFMW